MTKSVRATNSDGTVPAPGGKAGVVFAGFDQASAYLLDRVDVERMHPSRVRDDVLKLERMRRLLKLLGEPQTMFRSVHVAGTKGKGSTCEMIGACLEAAGYTVGMYTSPHLLSMCERVRINRQNVSEADFVSLTVRVAEAAMQFAPDDQPTFFELLTAMAFVHFAQKAVDIAVVEVGLGGRLDSTNVILPEVSVITGISLDHTQLLGETLEKIAREKAGIMKPGVPVVAAPAPVEHPEVLEVFIEQARRVNAPLLVLGREIQLSTRIDATPGLASSHSPLSATRRLFIDVACRGSERGTLIEFEQMAVPMMGEHQAVNCGLALGTLTQLSERGFPVSEQEATRGLSTVSVPGRMQLVSSGGPGSVRLLLDGAHNAQSIKSLLKGITGFVRHESLLVIFGCASDKDIDGMLRELSFGADKVIFTASQTVRAANPKALAKRFAEISEKTAQVAANLEDAMSLVKRTARREDLICITGSLYLVGEALKMVR